MNIDKDSGPVLVFRDIGRDEPTVAEQRDLAWIDHCRARERAERAAAKRATSEPARRVHQELAQAYVRMIERAQRRPGCGGDGDEPSEPSPGAGS